MSPAWQAFSDAVARRAGAGRAPVFWWRDDDATMPTPALQRLLELSYSSSVPLALAVVPEGAQPALFALLWGEVAVVQHGTDHRNRAAAGEKKTEFPAAERDDEALGRIARAREHLAALAGPRALPVLAPPWNRLRPALAGKLPLAGIHGLSAYGEKTVIAKGVTQVNTHVDIVAWREGKRFLGEDAALALARGRLERDEPLGWLTHHALHEADALDFLKRLFETSRRAGARWASARELWP
jgi:hypothetical protein